MVPKKIRSVYGLILTNTDPEVTAHERVGLEVEAFVRVVNVLHNYIRIYLTMIFR